MKKSNILSIAFAICASYAFASVQTDIETANKAGKVVFLTVTETGNPDNVAAKKLAAEAQKLYPKSAVIEMNRADKVNENLVTKYRLAGAPVPLILVVASNGVVAGGANFKQTTAENLVAMIPSLKKADVLKAINDGKSVFIVVSKKSMKKKDVLSKCEVACAEMKDNAKIVEVDFDDATEKNFLNELKITAIGDTPQTFVINSQGQIAGSFSDVTDSKTLVATATKKPAGGCCPPGSKKSCGPTKK
ncbi:MAG: hypothetical protein HYY40_10795 [Bacteroidetes bacterium]|nr:hypothetical protein [Bacteroidota bacterium]